MRYLYIKYNYLEVFMEPAQVIWDHSGSDKEREVLSYAISDDIESLNLNSNPGISPYANWIDGSKGKPCIWIISDTHKKK
jgi:hypothetical protein